MLACYKGQSEIVKSLIENETCPFTELHTKDNVNKTFLDENIRYL